MTQEEKWRKNYAEVAVEGIMKNDDLRNYQQEMIDRLEVAWKQYRSVMVQMPTGTGKTVLMAEVIRRKMDDGRWKMDDGRRKMDDGRRKMDDGRWKMDDGRRKMDDGRRKKEDGRGKMDDGILIVAHRRELLEQIRGTVRHFGIDMEKEHVVVESIQKLSRLMSDGRGKMEDVPFSPSLVIIDEAHHALAKTYRMLWERWPKAKFLGLTATPCRLNNEGFLDLFQTMVQSHTIQEFIKMGWLSDFDYVTAEPDNPILKQVGSLKKRGVDGDYQTKEMAMVMDCEESIENLYQAYRKFVNGKKGIVYAIDREHARHITEYYQGQGVRCAMIDAKTPKEERDRIVEEYKMADGRWKMEEGRWKREEGRCKMAIDVLVNVDVFGEGFDVPEVEFIQLARPTLSLSKYLQQVGRGMRIAEGKDKVVILDHVGMYQSFGLPTEDWNWPLMFTGQMAGKAGMGREGLLYIRGDGYEKELVNTHMVSIKRKDEAHQGLEIFIKGGLYGIAKDGRIVSQPLFERVRRADDGFFAYCTYPYLVYKNRSTIIDKDGRDLGLKMYGHLEWMEESLLKGHDIDGKEIYWDRKYNHYYHERPEFVSIGDVEMTKLRVGYVLRKNPSLIKPTSKRKIYYNRNIVWMDDWLISKNGSAEDGGYSPQRILSYGYNYFYVKTASRDLPDVTIIDTMGNFVNRRWTVPEEDDHRFPVWRQIPLRNAYTGEVGFPEK